MKKDNIRDCDFYLVTDSYLSRRGTLSDVKQAVSAGCRIVQYREKQKSTREMIREAEQIKSICGDSAIFIVNDRVDVALASDADGVHLGQEDLPYEYARKILGRGKIIGISTHDIEQARSAQMVGADYIGIGPIFATCTKPGLRAKGCEIVSRISKEINIPAFFIGGISLSNLHEILMRGGDSVAIASAILESGDIAETTKSFVKKLRGPREAVAI